MIPALVEMKGAPFRVLPPGIHLSSLAEIGDRFATNEHRRRIFAGFGLVATNLYHAGCTAIYLDGSFVTDKPFPRDFDGLWDPHGVNARKLDPVLLDYDNDRAAQKAKYLGEMFIASMTELGGGKTFLDFFQTDRTTGKPKGIVLLRPKGNGVSQ